MSGVELRASSDRCVEKNSRGQKLGVDLAEGATAFYHLLTARRIAATESRPNLFCILRIIG
jgi:hypothetical protein